MKYLNGSVASNKLKLKDWVLSQLTKSDIFSSRMIY